LDLYSNKLCAIYTGSSQVELNRLFRDHTSPLYNFARQHELTNLSIEFLYFISDNFTRKKKQILIPDAEEVWSKVEYSPYHFIKIIEIMLVDKDKNIRDACNQYLLKDKPH
jgi:hypothetical protein